MFKVLLIVYIVGGGGSDNVKNVYNTNFTFQEFYSMEDCQTAVKTMDGLLTWNRSPDGTPDAKKDYVKALYSTECVPMTATIMKKDESQTSWRPPAGPPSDYIPPVTEPPPTYHKHSRWDD